MNLKYRLMLSLATGTLFLMTGCNSNTNTSAKNSEKNILEVTLDNGYTELITFSDVNIPHIKYYKGKDLGNKPTTMDNENVDGGGDHTVATGGIDKNKVTNFIQNKKNIKFSVREEKNKYTAYTKDVTLNISKKNGNVEIYKNGQKNPIVTQEAPVKKYDKIKTKVVVSKENAKYFGGGMQNGAYDHTGHVIKIENLNDWLDRGVSSPAPFVWSNAGFGIINNTYSKGKYDFQDAKNINFEYIDKKSDNYYMIGDSPGKILNSYFELTGKPMIIPKFAWYPAHLNAYNRDTWVRVTSDSAGARKFEDGNYYKEYQPVNPKSFNNKRKDTLKLDDKIFVPSIKGVGDVTFVKDEDGKLQFIKESLNGEKDNYQFSARQIIDRYKQNDMPLGWFLPNDGYGAGYGQTDNLDKNIENLKDFSKFAKNNGVTTGLWTQENLHPIDPKNPKPDERDLQKEVSKADIGALKTDVAWVGDGYQAGIGALKDAANYMKKYGNNQRPFILTLDGWAGTQKYGAVWTGDQAGGTWENIGYQIPTYIGSSLSGLSNVGSDIDGIFNGDKPIIQTRDLQWKSFTPIQLNMDGWGAVNKTPFTFEGENTDINRFYLKLKSIWLPYMYSASYENNINGNPLLKPVVFDSDSISTTRTADLSHEFLLGDNMLIAPIYKDTKMNQHGDDVRNGIYLPGKSETWIDYFTGKEYSGDQVLNNFETPLWKTPIFIKKGAIIPENNPNNNPSEIDDSKQILSVYPSDKLNSTNVYDDDGKTDAYTNNEFTKTLVDAQKENNKTTVTINKTEGKYKGFQTNKETILKIRNIDKPSKVMVNGSEIPKEQYDFEPDHKVDTFSKGKDIPEVRNGSSLTINIPSHDITKENIKIEVIS